jgi:hypothetical protein
MYMQRAVNSGGVTQTPNPERDGTGELATIVACNAPAGLRIDALHFHAVDATAANVLRVYLSVGENIARLIKEIPVTAVTVSATAPARSHDWVFNVPLILEDGYSLKFAPSQGSARYHASVVSGGEL